MSFIILKAITRQCPKGIIFRFFDLFYRMQMNGRVKLQGERRILSIRLCSTSKSKEIQKKFESKGCLMLILSTDVTWCRHLFEVNLLASCLFHLASISSGTTKNFQRTRVDEEAESPKLSEWHFTASKRIWTEGKSKISAKHIGCCVIRHREWISFDISDMSFEEMSLLCSKQASTVNVFNAMNSEWLGIFAHPWMVSTIFLLMWFLALISVLSFPTDQFLFVGFLF